MNDRKIAIENFYGVGKHVYEDELGWQAEERQEARSSVSKEIFEFEIANHFRCPYTLVKAR